MPALPRVAPDAAGGTKAWVRATEIFDNRAYLGPPKDEVFPLVLVRKLSGSFMVSGGGVPIYEALMELAVWGENKKAAYATAEAAATLESAIESMPSGTAMGDAVGLGGHVQSSIPRPDPDTGQACVVITAEFQMRA